MGLLSEIQNDAVSENSSAVNILRRCLILAARMESVLLEDWVKHELNGYPDDVTPPDYRIMEMHFKGNFVGSFGRQLNNAPIPSHLINSILKNDSFSKFSSRQSLGTIDTSQERKNHGEMRVNFDNLTLILGDKIYDGYNAIQIWGEVPTMSVVGIVEAVKTRVLDFTLTLGKKYPIAGEIGGMSTSDKEAKDNISQIFHNTINGSVGMIGSANHSTINVTINAGDFSALRTMLQNNGVEHADIVQLESIINEPLALGTQNKFGPNVTQWIAGMLGKAVSGAWSISVTAGGAILEQALLAYYGLK